MAVPEKGPATSGPVTVVILQSVREGADEAYAVWQKRTNELAAGFPGFEGADVVPPQGIQTDWLVIYRFATQEQLQAWLGSNQLAAQRQEGEQYFASPPRQLAATTPDVPTTTKAASVVIRHHLRPGQEEAYQRWQQDLAVAEANAPGYLGSELIPPGPGADRVYSAIVRFDTPEHLDEWMNGPARKKLIESGKGIYQDFDATRVSGGFEGWFRFGQQGGLVEVPPVWKQTLSVLFGLYPTVMVLTFLVTSHIKWALAAVLLLGNTLSTFILSYAVMPYIVNPVLQWWLKPDPERRQTIDALGVLFIAAILGILAVFFWQITPVFIK